MELHTNSVKRLTPDSTNRSVINECTKHINLNLKGRALEDYLHIKQKARIRKDSVLVQPIFEIGVVAARYLQNKGLFTINEYKLRHILEHLSEREMNELFTLLQSEINFEQVNARIKKQQLKEWTQVLSEDLR